MKTVPRYAWVILAVVYFASVVAPFNQFKVPPVMPALIAAMDISLSQSGLLMSVIALVGLILALPAGMLLQRFGPKITGIVALAALALGSLWGAFAANFTILLLSRLLEGVGVGLISVVAPAMIALWFPPERQGAPMGIWATWVPVGTVVMYAAAPRLTEAFGWPSVWLLAAAYAAAMLLVYAAFIRLPAAPSPQPTTSTAEFQPPNPERSSSPDFRSVWLLALAFACYNLVFIAQGSYFPTFLNEVRQMPMAQASILASLGTMITLISAPLGGWISDRINSRRLAFSIPFLAFAPFFVLPYIVTGWAIAAVVLLQGILAGAVPTATFAATPELVRKPELAGLGLAIVLVGQNLGQLVGPMIFGAAVASWGWAAAGWLMVPFSLLGFIVAWQVKIR